ncbi:mas-related G-protein coupled receptor member H-like [Pleurodeles waltl]|uniref:mas-related G-protein coupled receptor member H-like n=1 Tax=Pleurodeles waltl TaxID=8319 RepID=UPI003709976E
MAWLSSSSPLTTKESMTMTANQGGPNMDDYPTVFMMTSSLEDYYDIDMEMDFNYLYYSIMALLSMPVVISVFGLAGNGLVLSFLRFRNSRNSFTIYILNLAITDCIVLVFMSLFCMLFLMEMTGLIAEGVPYDSVLEIGYFGYGTSQGFLTAISVERALSVLYPIWYRCRRPRHQSTIVCIIVWIFSCLMLAVNLVVAAKCEDCTEVYIIEAVLLFCFILPLMLLSNLLLLITIWKNSQKRHPPRPYILILSTVLAFLILSSPFALFCFLSLFVNIDIQVSHALIFLYSFCINSTLNPIIYFLVGGIRRQGRRSSLRGALRNAFQDETESSQDDVGTSSPRQSFRTSLSL